MSLDITNTVVSLVANIFLIISVFFVSLQMRARAKAQRAQAAWQSESAWARFSFDQASNIQTAELMTLIYTDTVDPELDDRKNRQAKHITRGLLQMTQSDFFLYREGILPKDNWVQERRWLTMFLSLPFVSNFLSELIYVELVLAPAFIEEISDIMPPSVGLR